MSETVVHPPEIYDAVPIEPAGRTCQRWVEGDDGMEPCENPAEYVFVFEASVRPDDDRRRNCLSCESCTPEVTI